MALPYSAPELRLAPTRLARASLLVWRDIVDVEIDHMVRMTFAGLGVFDFEASWVAFVRRRAPDRA